jgi:hypothetical protein
LLNDAFGEDIQQLVRDHAALQSDMQTLHGQLDALLAEQSSHGMIKSEELARILSHNNALVLREIEQLRRQHVPQSMLGCHDRLQVLS